MKKILISAALLSAIACGKPASKQDELDKLKKERDELNHKIELTEREITPGTNSAETGKPVSTEVLNKGYFEHYLDVQGRVDANENINVSAEAPGVVRTINVSVGQQVSKGQVLAELDNKIILQQVAALQSNLDLAVTAFQKQKALWDQKIGTEIQYLTAKAQKENAEHQMASLKEQLDMTRIKAPVAGTVDDISLKLGQAVSPGMPAVRVVNGSNLKVKADIAESYLSSIHQGSKVIIRLPESTDSLATQISYAARVVNELNRTFTVEVKVSGDRFHPNEVALLKISDYKSAQPVITIPVTTIQTSEEGQFVYVAEGGKAKKVTVKTGKEYNGVAEILSGLTEGEQLIIKGQQELNAGDVIAVKK